MRAAPLALLALSLPAQAEVLQVLRITPSGEDAQPGRQIVIAFDRDVVPLGRMERDASEVPVSITPEIRCDWRWLDPQTLACNLQNNEKLRPATRYEIELRPEIETVAGEKLERAVTSHFISERPMLRYSRVDRWYGPGEPNAYLSFNQPVTATSVAEALRYGDEPVTVEPEPWDSRTPFWTPQGEARNVWRVRPQRPLPLDRSVPLRLRPGLQSALGLETGVEDRVLEQVHTFPELKLLGVNCTLNREGGGQAGFASAGNSCDPMQGIALVFNAPVDKAQIKQALQLTPDPRKAFKDPAHDPWGGTADGENAEGSEGETVPDADAINASHDRGQQYFVYLPLPFAAGTAYQGGLLAGVKDRFGRVMPALPLVFRTGDREPWAVFEHENAVIESGVDSEVPIVVNNLQALDFDFTRLGAAGIETGQQMKRPVAAVKNIAFPMPLGVREMTGGRSAAVRGRFQTEPKSGGPREFFAQVTPWQVHAKLGHSNTLVWVTEMATGKPVKNAAVTVLDGAQKVLATAQSDGDGLAELPGTAALDPKLERIGSWNLDKGLAVRVVKDQDFALLPLVWDFQVDVYRASHNLVSSWQRNQHGHLRAWGTTAQGVYRVGDTVQYKIYVRDDSGRAMAAAPNGPYALKVFDPLGNAVLEQSGLTLSKFGALQGEFRLGERAAVGWYRFELTPAFADGMSLEPLRVLVSDFVPAPFRVGAELRAARAQPGDAIDALVSARLHGGGPFASAQTRFVLRLDSEGFKSKNALVSRYEFTTWSDRGSESLLDTESALDDKGELSQRITLPDAAIVYGRLLAEATVQDDRGRSIAGSGSIPYYGRDRYAGVRFDSWLLRQGEEATIEAIVADAAGEPVAGVPYYVKIERQETKGARVKGAGNAYITRYTSSWKRIATCKGRSRKDGMGCVFKPDQAGEFRVTVMTRDTKDRLHQSMTTVYAEGAEAVLWQDRPDYSLEVRADRTEYREGETARLFVKNPFPGATALVTVERYGVIERWVQKLSGSTPVIKLKIGPDFLPGVYVSVVVMSPRVEQPVKDGVDLGKPSFRMGYAKLEVKDPYKEVRVSVKPDREALKPRETVKVQLRAEPRHPKSGEPVEFAVAVLDEAVFDLIRGGQDYFDPLKGMTQLDELDLANYSLLTRLVGRQKFEKKGASPGGDGGADLSMRSIEKFVAYWNPALPADRSGRASFEFKAPDNLTGWRIFALAVTPTDRMGLGQGSVKVSKLTELRPAMPNQVVAGDRFDAGFVLLNRGDKPRTFKLTMKVEGAAQGEQTETLTLKSFERRTVFMPVQTREPGELKFSARAGDAADEDALAHAFKVLARKPNITVADYGHFVAGDTVTKNLALPPTLERGELSVSLSPTVIGNLDGSFEYFKGYPYGCWEQRLSKAVMAAHFVKLRKRLGKDADWPEAAASPQMTLDQAASFQAEAGGMGYWQPDSARQSPYLSAFTALSFGWLKDLGYAPPVAVWDKLDTYLLGLLKGDIGAEGYEAAETRAQLRAVILAALAQRGKLGKAELERHAEMLPRMGLFGQAMFIQAATRVEGSEALLKRAQALLLSRGQESAGRLALREDGEASWRWWLLGSELRSNCAALSALSGRYGWDASVEELPMKLTRAITQARGNRYAWGNTQENLFCTRAFIEYADRFESVPPQMQARIALDAAALGSLTVTPQQGGSLGKPLQRSDAGKPGVLTIASEGQGRAYYNSSIRYAEIEQAARPINAGMQIERSYFVRAGEQWLPLQPPMRLKRGDRLRVDLLLKLPSWMTYVVVDDPVPGGIEPINPDLGNVADPDAALIGGSYAFYHHELRHDAVRFFADAVDEGEHRLSWVGQAVATGDFAIPEAHAEQMYDPDVFGNSAPTRVQVTE